MLQRYIKIRDVIFAVSAVQEYVPRGNAHHRFSAVVDKLEELNSVCVKLQAEKCTVVDARLLFDACAAKYPVTVNYLNPNTNVVHSPDFEAVIVKIRNDLPLSPGEERAIESFVLPAGESIPVPRSRVDFDSTILHQAKKQCRSEYVTAVYGPLFHVAPSASNACERLFSEYKLVLTSLRSSSLPANFETMMF